MRLPCDIGGTFTDLVVEDDDRIRGMGVISGRHPRNYEAPFVNQVHIGVSGRGGTAVTDGLLSIIHLGNAGMCRIDCLEVDELHYPFFLKARHLVPDTEGAGMFRGPPSTYTEFGRWTAAP